MIVRHSMLSFRPTLSPPVVLEQGSKADLTLPQISINRNPPQVTPSLPSVDQEVLQVEPTKPTWVKWLVLGLGVTTLGIMVVYLVKT